MNKILSIVVVLLVFGCYLCMRNLVHTFADYAWLMLGYSCMCGYTVIVTRYHYNDTKRK